MPLATSESAGPICLLSAFLSTCASCMMSRFPAFQRVRSASFQVISSGIKPGVMLKKVKSESSIRFFAVADFEPKDTMRGALRLKQGDAVEVLERDPSGKHNHTTFQT